MKASELRIGNIVYDKNDNPVTVDGIHFYKGVITEDPILDDGYRSIKPHGIPLTEEWLLKFGFDRPFAPPIYEIVTANMDKRFRIHKVGEKSWMLGYYESITASIEYVHQLQNLYFALTGEELEIKKQVTSG